MAFKASLLLLFACFLLAAAMDAAYPPEKSPHPRHPEMAPAPEKHREHHHENHHEHYHEHHHPHHHNAPAPEKYHEHELHAPLAVKH